MQKIHSGPIYHDQETKIGVLNRIVRVLEPDGFLVLGATDGGRADGGVQPLQDRRGLYVPNKDMLKPGW